MPPGVTLRGVGVGRAAVVGPAVLLAPVPVLPDVEPAAPDAAAAERRVGQILADISAELVARADATDGVLADVLRATAGMAADPALIARTEVLIHEGIGPATAIDRAVGEFSETFRAAGGYLAERVTDLESVRHRAVARLLGLPEPGTGELSEPSVIVADDLSPADTAALDLRLVAGIVTARGSLTSHTAIIAGQLGLPCVVAVREALSIRPGATVAVDSATGRVWVDPDAATIGLIVERGRVREELEADADPGSTSDGHPVQILANIGTLEDAARASGTAVEGVGLFRTEVLYLDQNEAPSVEQQTAVYREVLGTFAGRKVVVRTLDAGADKPLAFATMDAEENPALGVRGYRLVRTLPALLDDQLNALAAAQRATGAQVHVMAPMVATSGEAKDFAGKVRAAGLGSAGVMVEVPAAALRSARILEHVDFVSIGTNDLAQYTMAADRLSGALADLLDMWQPAVLDLVAQTAWVGRAMGKPVGVCGESAGDPFMALVLCGLGVTSLSMSAPSAPAVRFALRRHTKSRCEAMAAAAREAEDATEARATVLAMADPAVVDVLAPDDAERAVAQRSD